MAPSRGASRDGLGRACFWLHVAVMVFIVLGWLMPSRFGLMFYLFFLPAVVLHWKLNKDACILNNLENWLRFRRWRAPDRNAEEGAWLRSLVGNLTGRTVGRAAMDRVIHGGMALFWLLALGHFFGFAGS